MHFDAVWDVIVHVGFYDRDMLRQYWFSELICWCKTGNIIYMYIGVVLETDDNLFISFLLERMRD